MNVSTKMQAARERYEAAAHAVQSGVATEMNIPGREAATTPKHLRVGVNMAMTDHASLAELLMAKGIISEEEYFEALAAGAEREKRRYEELLSEIFNKQITLA
jgi:hypothetical protein